MDVKQQSESSSNDFKHSVEQIGRVRVQSEQQADDNHDILVAGEQKYILKRNR